MKKLVLLFFVLGFTVASYAQKTTYQLTQDIHYYHDSVNQSDDYINERCVLDIYYPANSHDFATIVWFHGGGLSSYHKEIPEALKNKGVCVIGVNYRLHPKVQAPKYIEDAAAAVSWVFHHINEFGGDSSLIFISGHSAGGYLASMVGLDKSWLGVHHVNANDVAGIIPFSGHTITHFTVRKERGIEGTQPVIDSLAPLYHVRADASPLLLITGDRELEMLGRYEENAYMMRMMKVAGHQQTRLFELDGYDHGGMVQPALPLLLNEVTRIVDKKNGIK